MTLFRVASLIGVALLVLISNVVVSIAYMFVYGYLINPGHPKEYYDQHVQVAAPYCSIVAGIPLMFLAGFWVAGWSGSHGLLGVKAALVVWLAYAVIDLGIVLAASAKDGLTTKMGVLVAVSILTKLVAAYAGGVIAVRSAASSASVGPS